MKLLSSLLALFVTAGTPPIVYADSTNFIVIDVRTPEEYSDNHVKNSINIDIYKSDFKEKISKLDKSKTYKLYCRTGNRSGQAMRLMQNMGFENVENLGSVSQAAKRLNRTCEGPSAC